MNYYEQPVAQTFMDTYAPLPFQEMAMLGSAYKKEKDETEARIDEFKSTYGDFTSMSQADTEAWDRETMGRLTPSLLQMAGDPEKIKSQEFQAGIRSAIRGVDSAKLGALRQSSENLKQRAVMTARLIAEGKYKQSWDPINVATWDTSKQGIMTDLSPLEYKSLHDIAAPYSQALKDSYLRPVNNYKYMVGVDEKMIRNSLSTAATDIFNTPQGQAWYRDISSELATQGVTDPNAVREEVMNRLVQSQKDYIHENVVTDDAALKFAELNRRYPAGGKETNVPPRYTDQLRYDSMNYLTAMFNSVKAQGGNPTRVIKDVFNAGAKVQNDKGTYNNKELREGTKAIMDTFSVPTSREGSESIISQYSTNVLKTGKDGKTFVFDNSANLENPTTIVSSIGSIGLNKYSNDFDEALSSGAFTNVKVTPMSGEKAVFSYTGPNGELNLKQRVKVTVSEDDIDFNKLPTKYREYDTEGYRGYKNLDQLLRVNGAKVTSHVPEPTNRISESYETSDGEVAGNKKINISQSRKGKFNRTYTIELLLPVANSSLPGQSEMESAINNAYDRMQNVSSSKNTFYPWNVNTSQGSIYEE